MTEPRFKRGDLVRHRASGEVAVVVDANERCTRHSYHLGTSDSCEWKFAGTYDLDLGFWEDVIAVEEYLLEAVDPEPEGEGGP